MPNDAAKIEEALRQFAAACTAGDSGAAAKRFDEGVVFMPPDSPEIAGKEAVTAWMQSAVFNVMKQNLKMNLGQAQFFGDQAVITGSFSVEMTPKSGGRTVKGTGKHMAQFKKQKDGSWKYARAIWNFDKPPA
jgi:uncharacterized protein (TIGR02246 family)